MAFNSNVVINGGSVFTAQLSNASGSFASSTAIGTFTGAQSGTINATIPAGTASGTGYRIRVVCNNPAATGTDNGANITINALVTPSVTINSNPAGAVCYPANIQFTATPANGGTSPSYQWKKNGNNVGSNNNSYSDNTLVTGDAISCVITSNASCLTTTTATSNTISINIVVCSDGDLCTTDNCVNGACPYPPLCTDSDPCTNNVCNSGVCSFPSLNCNDNNLCTTDACGALGCTNTPINCSDGNLCTNDVCTNGVCTNPAKCDDGNACTSDACNSNNGNCTNSAMVCNDNNTCTSDACVNGVCQFTDICVPPWVVTATGLDHTIILDPAYMTSYISGLTIAIGDYIGVFYLHNGTYYPAGKEKWTGSPTALFAYGNDATSPAKNGLSTGEIFKFKIWRLANSTEYDVDAVYLPLGSYNGVIVNTNTFSNNGISGISELSNCVKQNIPINAGWNMISSYVIPDAPSMPSVFSQITSDIFIVKNIVDAYTPVPLINQIGNWDVRYGYKVKARNSTSLLMKCTRTDPFTPIPLGAGWSIISYLPGTPMNVATAMVPLGTNLIIVKTIGTTNYIPAYNINTIGNMQPGQGYQLKVFAADTFIYPAPRVGPDVPYSELIPTAHFVGDVVTGSTATLIIPENVLAGAYEGDEIGVFTGGGLLAGSAVVEHENFAITVWGDDASTVNLIEGMAENEPFRFRLWNHSTGTERELILNFSEGPDYYETDGISVAGGSMFTGVVFSGSEMLLKAYPNPASGKFFFEMQMTEPSEISIRVFDIAGKVMQSLEPGNLVPGRQLIETDITGLADGKYLFELRAGKKVFCGYIVVAK